MQQLGIVLLEFIDQYLKFFFMIIAVGRYQKKKNRVSFNMPEKTMTQTFPFCSSFNDTRKIGDTKTSSITVFNHTQVGCNGGECIISDLGFGSGNNREQG